MRKTRLAALFAVLLLALASVAVAGCGGGGDSTTGGGGGSSSESGGEPLTVGSDIPLSSRGNPATTPASTSNCWKR
jgi:hypothetical protein